ncbi:MAG: polysaccharide deacetylase family protein [Coriobacteriia bacterium]|nr:polysaccharide deacetylase family protein [Coriobacteriia bacterium]
MVRSATTARCMWVLLAFVSVIAVVTGCVWPPWSGPSAPGQLPPAEEPAIAPGPALEPVKPAPVEPTPPVPGVPEPTDGTTRSWFYTADPAHRVPRIPDDAARLLSTYGGRYTGPDPGLVYLTIDQGYENGNTPAILDALARNGVKATFFVTGSYVRSNPDLVRRMAADGHVVGNHTMSHPSLPDLVDDRAMFEAELAETSALFRDVTGMEMARVMRPPMGEYSARSLWLTQQLGYESVFWGFAHRDWIVDDQPPVGVTIERILSGSHPGAIYLLHGVSSSDTQALDAVIAGLREQGYAFGTL